MDTAKKLYDLYVSAKSEENSLDYIDELIDQLSFFGLETNTLTRAHVRDRLENILISIRNTLCLFLLSVLGCSPPTYTVVSSFNEVVLITHNKEKAFETADLLTSEGRVLASKPQYYVRKEAHYDRK
jgi:hypothetical protein